MKHTTTNFYVPPENIRNGKVHFPEGEGNHIVRVLRAEVGDLVVVVDGCGRAYLVELTKTDPSHSRGKIVEEVESAREPKIHQTLAIGTIHHKRLETAWDACVQLGISRLIPLRTEYGLDRIRRDGKFIDRLRAVSVRAMKQSGRAVLPAVEQPLSLVEVLNSGGYRHILVGDPDGLPNLTYNKPKLGERVLLVVGPEGGLSAEERRLLTEHSGIQISLGPRRLRTETAAVALSVIALKWTEDI
ncbi:hypothetical protein DRQ36_07465 [bacterium]|nr:MAG: hypothetical protein DRQ36_07465 [bacterium]